MGPAWWFGTSVVLIYGVALPRGPEMFLLVGAPDQCWGGWPTPAPAFC